MPLPITDPYTDSVINHMPDEIRASFSTQQIQALQQALSKSHQQSRHLLDVRMLIPLYWTRFYLVIFMGRDRRSHVQDILIHRRQSSSRTAQIGFIALAAWFLITGLAVSGFITFYLIKSALGIDIFPDKHLGDFLP